MPVENKIVDPFTNIPYMEIPTAEESDNGEFLNNMRTLNVGDGEEGFRMDEQGIWLGALLFANAPFSVSMAGAVIASNFTLTGGVIQTASGTGKRIVLSGNKLIAYSATNSPLFELLGSDNEVVKYYSDGTRRAMYLFENTSATADLIYCEMGAGTGKAIHVIGGKNSSGSVDLSFTTGIGLKMQSANAAGKPTVFAQQLDLDKTAIVITDNTSTNEQNEAMVEILGLSTSNALPALLSLQGNSTSKQAAIRMTSIGGDPSSPVNGDIWNDGTNLHIKLGGTIYHINMTAA